MQDIMSSTDTDALLKFKAAYQNRYTWEPTFKGYQGICSWKGKNQTMEGEFHIGQNLKPIVKGIYDDEIKNLISSQLWEVAIHRVRRSFDDVHGANTFTSGDINEKGLEIIVNGKNQGDKYRVKDNIVTMVYRNIHGKLINIYTDKVIDTGSGYLSHLYTSQYLDPISAKPISGKAYFEDTFVPLKQSNEWVLSKRLIETNQYEETLASSNEFNFSSLEIYN